MQEKSNKNAARPIKALTEVVHPGLLYKKSSSDEITFTVIYFVQFDGFLTGGELKLSSDKLQR